MRKIKVFEGCPRTIKFFKLSILAYVKLNSFQAIARCSNKMKLFECGKVFNAFEVVHIALRTARYPIDIKALSVCNFVSA